MQPRDNQERNAEPGWVRLDASLQTPHCRSRAGTLPSKVDVYCHFWEDLTKPHLFPLKWCPCFHRVIKSQNG